MSEADKKAPEIGHNSERFDSTAATRIRQCMDRVGKLTDERKDINDSINDVYAEMKGVGFDVKVLRKLFKLERMEAEKRREAQELLDLYKAALGMD